MRIRSGDALLQQLWKFALVGGMGFVLDVAVFNTLRLTVLAPERVHEGPLLAKTISTVVGGMGFVLDVAVFNALRLTVLAPERVHEGPLLAKTISTVVAIIANWLGNRYWTFGPHRSTRGAMEALEFVAVSILGMFIGLGCLWVSHYVLKMDTVLADNISSNVIGLLLGSAVRFLLYRHWVYHPARRNRISASAAQPS